jgi:hypothetical protein
MKDIRHFREKQLVRCFVEKESLAIKCGALHFYSADILQGKNSNFKDAVMKIKQIFIQ